MRIEPFLFVFLAFGYWLGPQRVVGGVIAAALFGATAVVAVTALGGAPVTPAVAMIPFLFVYALRDRGSRLLTAELAFPQPGFWLALLAVWIVIGAIFFPRLMQGDMYVFSADRSVQSSGGGLHKALLKPMSTNITQTIYAVASTVSFLAARCLMIDEFRLRMAANGVLWLALLNLVAVFINLAENYAGAPPILVLIKNAEYAVMENGTVAGLVRISGTFSEPSAFAGFSLPLFGFTFMLYLGGYRRRMSGWVALGTFLSLVASTSSTALGALVIYFAMVSLGGIAKLFTGARIRFGVISVLAWALLTGMVAGALLYPKAVDAVYDYGYNLLYKKLDSESAIERHSWNVQAMENFYDSYGAGIGVGSARASNFAVVLLSNLGVPGFLMFVAFIWQAMFGRRGEMSEEAAVILRGARSAVLILLMGGLLSAAVYDLGMAFYMYCAVAAYRGMSHEQLTAASPDLMAGKEVFMSRKAA
ncbi:hypothetical protein [Derxia gummosa]|uniref:Uncharacterized protein n=1 Tax=Derxia gummosa DSM 723 TaxID=1121388 RepID=A0A8B6X0R6_9BURK|nr:hypothetical protein [Derxia gummosa]